MKILVGLAFSLFFFLGLGLAHGEVQVQVQGSTQLMNMACFPDADSSVDAAFGLRYHGGSPGESGPHLSRVLKRIQELNGGQIPDWAQRMNVQVFSQGRPTPRGITCASYAAGNRTIQLVTGCNNQARPINQVVGTFAHEIGHVLGQQQARYQAYEAAVQPKCEITRYCTHNRNPNSRNEEFAETFALYLHAPDRLFNYSPACRKAFEYFKQRVFPAGPLPASSQCTGLYNPSGPGLDDHPSAPLRSNASADNRANELAQIPNAAIRDSNRRQGQRRRLIRRRAPPPAPTPTPATQ